MPLRPPETYLDEPQGKVHAAKPTSSKRKMAEARGFCRVQQGKHLQCFSHAGMTVTGRSWQLVT